MFSLPDWFQLYLDASPSTFPGSFFKKKTVLFFLKDGTPAGSDTQNQDEFCSCSENLLSRLLLKSPNLPNVGIKPTLRSFGGGGDTLTLADQRPDATEQGGGSGSRPLRQGHGGIRGEARRKANPSTCDPKPKPNQGVGRGARAKEGAAGWGSGKRGSHRLLPGATPDFHPREAFPLPFPQERAAGLGSVMGKGEGGSKKKRGGDGRNPRTPPPKKKKRREAVRTEGIGGGSKDRGGGGGEMPRGCEGMEVWGGVGRERGPRVRA